MPETALVTDSSACLPEAMREQHGIRVVALSLQIGDETFADGAIAPGELFRLADDAKSAARTASPSPSEFVAAFREAVEGGASRILCLTLSAAFSGTYDSAVAAKGLAAELVPGAEIRVVDTGGLAMTHGFGVLAAARALEGGATAEEAATRAREVAGRARLAGLLGTTRYLARGGRVPWIAHWAAQFLQIRPLLAFDGGRARSIGRVRTTSRGLERLIEYAERHGKRGMRVAVTHTEAPEAAEALARMACEAFSPVELLRTDFTSVMAVHTGPGFVGLAFHGDGEG